jgi:hypothetical protein
MIVGQPIDELMAIAAEFFGRHQASLRTSARYAQGLLIAWASEVNEPDGSSIIEADARLTFDRTINSFYEPDPSCEVLGAAVGVRSLRAQPASCK